MILHKLGVNIGRDLNPASDNLTFTYLFKRPGIQEISQLDFEARLSILEKSICNTTTLTTTERQTTTELQYQNTELHRPSWQAERVDAILSASDFKLNERFWGWKEPNSHIIIDRLLRFYPNSNFLYVYRNGLDMAYSRNHLQLALWGEEALGRKVLISPHDSLKFWCHSHRRMQKLKILLPDRLRLQSFEQFLFSPNDELADLLEFFKLSCNGVLREEILSMVKTPASINRYQKHGLTDFDPADIEYVQSLGFVV